MDDLTREARVRSIKMAPFTYVAGIRNSTEKQRCIFGLSECRGSKATDQLSTLLATPARRATPSLEGLAGSLIYKDVFANRRDFGSNEIKEIAISCKPLLAASAGP